MAASHSATRARAASTFRFARSACDDALPGVGGARRLAERFVERGAGRRRFAALQLDPTQLGVQRRLGHLPRCEPRGHFIRRAIGIAAGAKALPEQHRGVGIGRTLVRGELGDRHGAGGITASQLDAGELHARRRRLRAQLGRRLECLLRLVQFVVREGGETQGVLRRGEIRIRLDRLAGLRDRFGRRGAIAQQHAGLGGPRRGESRTFLDQFVEVAMGLGFPAGAVFDRSDAEPRFAGVGLLRRLLQLGQELHRIGVPPDPHVVVGERQPPGGVDRERAEMRLGLRDAVRS